MSFIMMNNFCLLCVEHRLDEHCMEEFAEALKVNTTLTSLVLSGKSTIHSFALFHYLLLIVKQLVHSILLPFRVLQSRWRSTHHWDTSMSVVSQFCRYSACSRVWIGVLLRFARFFYYRQWSFAVRHNAACWSSESEHHVDLH